jgi:hypothetical protein
MQFYIATLYILIGSNTSMASFQPRLEVCNHDMNSYLTSVYG